jgi:hypothetical protein
MNARPRIRELDRISRDIGVRLRIEPAAFEPLPENLIALLRELEILVHHAEGERLFAAIDARVAELLDAAGQQPRHAYAQGRSEEPVEADAAEVRPNQGR